MTMALNYNPAQKVENEGSGKAQPGRYTFRVDDVQEKMFRSGNEGLSATLLVAVNGARDLKVFSNFVYTPKALWKLKEFFDAIGVDFEHPPEPWDLVGKTGVAEFVVGEKGYLEVDTFLPGSANAGRSKPAARLATMQQPVAALSDDVPF
jgi:hypothetical protein